MLTEPRTDIPTVTPLPCGQKTDGRGYGVNSLHRLIAEIIEARTGQPTPGDEELLVYIQKHYGRLFIHRAERRAQTSGRLV